MGRGRFEATVVVKRATPLDEELIKKDFEVFDVYIRREAILKLDKLRKGKDLSGKFVNLLAKIPFLTAGRTFESIDSLIDDIAKNNILLADVRTERDTVTCRLRMAAWFVASFSLLGAMSLPVVGSKLTEREIVNTFRNLVKRYFDPEKQPYEVVSITFP